MTNVNIDKVLYNVSKEILKKKPYMTLRAYVNEALREKNQRELNSITQKLDDDINVQ